jgi:type I restriction enzyme, S subunit
MKTKQEKNKEGVLNRSDTVVPDYHKDIGTHSRSSLTPCVLARSPEPHTATSKTKTQSGCYGLAGKPQKPQRLASLAGPALPSPALRFPEFSGDWEENKLGAAAAITMGQSPESENYNENGVGKLLIQGNADISGRFIVPRYYTTQITKECKVGDIIMTVRAPVGYIAKSNYDAVIGRGVCAIRNNSESILDYLYQFLLNYEIRWEKYSQGSTFTAVNSKDIKDLKIILPSLIEQQKIAAFLIALDARTANLSAEHAQLTLYKKSLMQKLFSQSIRFTDTNGKQFPDWEEKKLGEICDLINGYAFESCTYNENGSYKIVTIGNVQNGSLDLIKINKILELPIDLQKSQILNHGDFLISMTGNVGRVCVVDQENCLLNQRVGKLVVKENNTQNNFLYQILNAKPFEIKMQSLGQGGAQDNISKKDILNFKFKLPDFNEQQKIASFLSSVDELLALKQQQISLSQTHKKGLMQKMFV